MASVLGQVVAEGRDELTPEESRAFAEEQTQEYFGMTVEEFRLSAERGEFDEGPGVAIHIALLTGARLPAC